MGIIVPPYYRRTEENHSVILIFMKLSDGLRINPMEQPVA